MDSLNLSGNQNNQVNSRSTASNTIPFTCASCGSTEHIQPFLQADCFRAFCPFTPSLKKSAGNCENNFVEHHPLFPSFSVLHPLFNTLVPPNAYCPQSNVTPPSSVHISGECKKEKNDFEKSSQPLGTSPGFQFRHPLKPETKTKDTPPVNSKNGCVCNGGNPMHEFCPQDLIDQMSSPCLQRCACGDSLSWPCSPFIVPIISYYLLWNPHQGKVKTPSNSSTEAENVQKNADLKNQGNSKPRLETNVTSNNFQANYKEINVKKTNDKESIQDESLQSDNTKLDWKTNITNNESCTSIMSFCSSHYAENNECFNLCKIIEDRTAANNAENDMEINDTFSVEKPIDKIEMKIEEEIMECENDITTPSELSLSDIIRSNNSNTNLAISRNSTNLKEQLDLLEIDSEKKSHPNKKAKKNDCQSENTSERSEGSSKKENFSLASRKREDLQAAGDCSGNIYGVNIPAFENPSQNNGEEIRKKKNLEQGEAIAKGLLDVEVQSLKQTKTGIIHGISVGSEIKCPKLKSGIAKLSCNFKLQESKAGATTETSRLRQKNVQQKDSLPRKHNCLSTEVKIDGNDNHSKYEKTKLFIKEQPKGKGKTNPKSYILEIKGQSSGKEDRGRFVSIQERNLSKNIKSNS